MPRSLRLEFSGAVYHVMNRGNYRQDLFIDEGTYESFENCLFESLEKCDFELLGYCVMRNHFHLIIRTRKGNLSYGMKWLQSTWATRFNRYRNERGRLFQGRFKSLIVDDENYLGGLLAYVHLNPVRANICSVENLEQYRWSSYWYVKNKQKRPERLLLEEALYHSGKFGDNKKGHKQYSDYLDWLTTDKKAQKDLLFDKLCSGWAIGDKEFKKKLLEKAGLEKAGQGGALPRYEGRELCEINEELWLMLLKKCLKHVNKREKEIKEDIKSADWKVMIAHALKEKTSATNVWLTRNLNMGIPQGVSRYASEFRRQGLEKGKEYKRLIQNITE